MIAAGRVVRYSPFLRRSIAALAMCAGASRLCTAQTSPRDTVRPAPSDSAARDSIVTRTLEQDTAGTVRPAAFSVLGLDRLRLRTVGVTYGWAWPAQATATRLYSLSADYGEIARGVRVVFVSSFWTTHYRDAEVARLAREVGRAAGVDSVRLGTIRLDDLSGGAEARWEPGFARLARARLRVLRPWVGGGMAVHFVNVEGAPISGTFVERALDAASIGTNATLGVDWQPLTNILATMQARYDFLGVTRFATMRAGASFLFRPSGAR